MSDLVGNPEDRFSQNEAHLYLSFFDGDSDYYDLGCLLWTLSKKSDKKNLIIIHVAVFWMFTENRSSCALYLLQLFWEKRLQGLKASDSSHETIEPLNLPTNVQGKISLQVPFLAHLRGRLKGELIVYRSSRRPSVCVHTFKHEYL